MLIECLIVPFVFLVYIICMTKFFNQTFSDKLINEYRIYMKKEYKDQVNSDLHRLSELYLIFARNTLV